MAQPPVHRPGPPSVHRPGPPPPAAAGWPAVRTPPSGLFPTVRPPRPTYREPHPVRAASVAVGVAATVIWFLLFGLLGSSLGSYARWTLFAGLVAWAVALLLTRVGDRGVAVGIAVANSVAWSAAAIALAVRWAHTGDWPLW